MKWYWWILLVLFVLAILLWTWYKNLLSKINITFKFGKVDLKGISISDIIVSGQTDIDLDAEITVTNDSIIDLSISDLRVEVFYRGQLVAMSKEILTSEVVIPKKDKAEFTIPLLVLLDSNTLNLLVQYTTRRTFSVEYRISFKTLNLPVTITGLYTEDYA